MQILKNKTKTVSTTLILILTMTALVSVFSTATAQTKIKTVARLNANPKLVGMGQDVLVNSWTTPQTPMVPGTSGGEVRHDYYYDITKPDGGTQTIGPHDSDSGGSATDWFKYTPDQLGTYTLTFRWAGDDLYMGSVSNEATFTVQEDPTPQWQGTPLPEGYWTRPISAANREWNVLGGAWMSSYSRDTPCFNAYSEAPDSAHIVWKLETGMGGLVGGDESRAYASSAPSKVIMFGRAYFKASDGIHCVDVHTGEELWDPPAPSYSGTLWALPGPSTPYLWLISGSGFRRLNAATGELTKTVTGQPSGQELMDPAGSTRWRANRHFLTEDGILYINVDDVLESFVGLLAYDTKVSSSDFWAGVLWRVQRVKMGEDDMRLYNYPYGNSTAVIVENFTMPPQDLANMAVDTERDIIYDSPNGGWWTAAWDATNGNLLWNIKRDAFFEGQPSVMDGVGVSGAMDTNKVYGFDLNTGNQLWETEATDMPWGGFRAYCSGAAYGKTYHLCYDGTIRAYYASNGTTAWTVYSGDDIWGETPYGTWPFYGDPAIADGKVYAYTYEHSATQPLKRGERLYAIDDATGEVLWSIMGCNRDLAIADGVLVASDGYMPMMYGFAKGQTETTVSASPKVMVEGNSVLIEGTVMDMSPAQPNTPAISDDDMSVWMEYLNMQQPMPKDAKGVDVSIDVIDANGNYRTIGTATSDMSGFYSFSWMPDVPGKYTVIANFEGSDSYYSSLKETAFVVDKALETPPPEVTPAPMTDTYLTGSTIAILAGIAVAVFLILRKK